MLTVAGTAFLVLEEDRGQREFWLGLPGSAQSPRGIPGLLLALWSLHTEESLNFSTRNLSILAITAENLPMMTSSHCCFPSALFITACIGLLGQPAMAGGGPPSYGGNHLQCYKINDMADVRGTVVDVHMAQLGELRNCKLSRTVEFCAPATKTVLETGPNVDAINYNGEGVYDDFVCYTATCDKVDAEERTVLDQFGVRDITLNKPFKLCAPALKLVREACAADSTDDLFVDNCRRLSVSPETCNQAWQISHGTDLRTSCFYGTNANGYTGCYGCGPFNEASGVCTNSCDDSPPPACDDADRTFTLGCPGLSSDSTACNGAWQISRGTFLPTSCFYGPNARGNIGCYGCGPNNELSGVCTNFCDDSPLPACIDDNRTSFTYSCRAVSDMDVCNNTAWQYSRNGLVTSCWWGTSANGSGPGCFGCGPYNELSELCTNSCDDSPLPACNDSSRRYTRNCRNFEEDENACNDAWHISNGTDLPTSCFYGNNYRGDTGCWGCGPSNANAGLCDNLCTAP
jgi:hypothetical protein